MEDDLEELNLTHVLPPVRDNRAFYEIEVGDDAPSSLCGYRQFGILSPPLARSLVHCLLNEENFAQLDALSRRRAWHFLAV